METLPAVSLFTGAGGLDLGVEDAGGSVRVALEPDPDCVATLSCNRRFFPVAKVIPRPLEDVSTDEILDTASLRPGETALLLGGPPCQPFSKSGYWLQERRRGATDPRAALVDEYLRVLRQARPEAFIFENVAGLTHPSTKEILEGFVRRAKRYGYAVEARLLHAVEFGVPQTRVRLFVIGLRGRGRPPLPKPTHWWHTGENGQRMLRPPETAGRWIAGLDRQELSEPGEVVCGRWERQLQEIPPGWNYIFHTAWAGHPRPSFVFRAKYWTFLLKLNPYRPSWTVQASAGPWTGPFHWENRRLRVPELAALQTFPRGFRFTGDLTDQRRQVGNAVPCLLASRVASELLAAVSGSRPRRSRRLRYALAPEFDFDPRNLRYQGRVW